MDNRLCYWGKMDAKTLYGVYTLANLPNRRRIALQRRFQTSGRNITHFFASIADDTIMKELLSFGIKPTSRDTNRRIALHYAVEADNIPVIKLLANKNDVNVFDSGKMSPLMLAKSGEAVDILISSGADLSVNSLELLKCSIERDTNVLDALLKHNVSPCNRQPSFLSHTAFSMKDAHLRVLLESGLFDAKEVGSTLDNFTYWVYDSFDFPKHEAIDRIIESLIRLCARERCDVLTNDVIISRIVMSAITDISELLVAVSYEPIRLDSLSQKSLMSMPLRTLSMLKTASCIGYATGTLNRKVCSGLLVGIIRGSIMTGRTLIRLPLPSLRTMSFQAIRFINLKIMK